LHQFVTDRDVPLGRIVVEPTIEDSAEQPTDVHEIGIDEEKQDARVKEKHDKHSIYDSSHLFRVGIITNPSNQLDSDCSQNDIDGNNEHHDSICENERWE